MWKISFCIGAFPHSQHSPQSSKMVLCWNGSTVLSGDIAGILVSCALRDRSSEHKGWVSRLVSSTCLIYCPSAFEVGQAEFTSLWFFVISPPRLQPRWGPSPSTTGYRKYLSLIAPGHSPWTSSPSIIIADIYCMFQCTRPFCLYMLTYTCIHTTLMSWLHSQRWVKICM